MPPHCLADGERSLSDGEVDESASQHSRAASYGHDDESDEYEEEHQWNSFEMRTLFCLIIKGEHQDRNGLLANIDLASKLNTALNPGKPTGKKAEKMYARDIPVKDVGIMLRRVLDKKLHAVDVVSRSNARVVTRRQLRAFTRQLDFRGDAEEWAVTGRKAHVEREQAELKRRMDKHEDGRRISPERDADNRARKEEIEDYRAQRLIEDWRIGRSFYEESSWKHPRETETATDAALSPARGRSPTRRRLNHDEDDWLAGSSINKSSHAGASETTRFSNNTLVSGSDKTTGMDIDWTKSKNIGGRTPAWDITSRTPAWEPSARSTIPTPLWGIAPSSIGGGETPNIAVAATPQPPAGGWGGGFGDASAPTPRAGGYGSGYGAAGSSSSTAQDPTAPVYSYGYEAAITTAQSGAPTSGYANGYGGMSNPASIRTGAPSAQSAAPTPVYGNGYGGMSAAASVRSSGTPLAQSGAPAPAYTNGYGGMSAIPSVRSATPLAQSGAPTPAYGQGYGGMSGAPSVRSGAPPSSHEKIYGAASNSAPFIAPTPAYGNGNGTAALTLGVSAPPAAFGASYGAMHALTQPDMVLPFGSRYGATTPLAQYNGSMPTSSVPMGPPAAQRPVAPMGFSAPAKSSNNDTNKDKDNNAHGGGGSDAASH